MRNAHPSRGSNWLCLQFVNPASARVLPGRSFARKSGMFFKHPV
jgi:hypothetical protein